MAAPPYASRLRLHFGANRRYDPQITASVRDEAPYVLHEAPYARCPSLYELVLAHYAIVT